MDFAYHVHTNVGDTMVGAKVNGKLVEASHVLSNADIVEILLYDGPATAFTVLRHQVPAGTCLLALAFAIWNSL